MSLESALLKRLEATQVDLAKQALTSPQGRDAFEYGRMCGIYAGVEKARELLIELIDDQDRANKDL